MKTTKISPKSRGIAVTEYLIILALVAIASITIVGLFGQQIKIGLSRAAAALAGTSTDADKAMEIARRAEAEAAISPSMADFAGGQKDNTAAVPLDSDQHQLEKALELIGNSAWGKTDEGRKVLDKLEQMNREGRIVFEEGSSREGGFDTTINDRVGVIKISSKVSVRRTPCFLEWAGGGSE